MNSLRSGFLRSFAAFPARPALDNTDGPTSYAELAGYAKSIASALDRHAAPSDVRLTAILAEPSVTAYAGFLAALFRGHGYVPMVGFFPTRQLVHMLDKTGCRSLIVDAASVGKLEDMLPGIDTGLTIALPDHDDIETLRQAWPEHVFLGPDDMRPARDYALKAVAADDIAYVMFTSGSTGRPKAVPITHANIRAFIDFSVDRYAIVETDRFSQRFPFTFDISVFDMFVAWERGACVCFPTAGQTMFPAQYIHDAGLTIWYADPSMLFHMRRLGALHPGMYPDIRLSLFVGEALPADLAQEWALAAPNAVVENLYGPTELTLTCTCYTWDRERSMGEALNGIAPIGTPHPGMTALIVDENLKEVLPGEDGELLMTGDQMAPGYLGDPERTAAAFVTPPGKDRLYYRTGDRVRRPARDGLPICFIGRNDHQVQVQGVRVELGEVENAIRDEAGVDRVVVLGWPVVANRAEGLVAFIDRPGVSQKKLRRGLAKRLVALSIPHRLVELETFPLNANGKIDRHALTRLLTETERA